MDRIGLLPSGLSVLAGGLDGVVAHADAKAARAPFSKQWSTYLEAGYAVTGALMAFLRMSPEIAYPLWHGGLYELSRKGGFWAIAQSQGVPVAYPYAPAAAALPMADFAAGQTFIPRREKLGAFG